MFHCPECYGDTRVIDVRESDIGIRRRRECADCGCKFGTTEVSDGDTEIPKERVECKERGMSETVVQVCKDCNVVFETPHAELDWLIQRDLKPYTRCKRCRMKRRYQQLVEVGQMPVGVTEEEYIQKHVNVGTV